MLKRSLLSAAAVCAAVAAPVRVRAVDYFWDGSSNTSWNFSGNWTPTGVPDDASDRAIFNLAGNHTVLMDASFTNRALEVRNGTVTLGLGDYTLQPAAAGAVAVTVGTASGVPATLRAVPIVGFFGGIGLVNADGPLLIASVAGSTGHVQIGLEFPVHWTSSGLTIIGSAGAGSLTMAASSRLTDTGAVLGGLVSGTGSGTANITGGTWTNHGNLIVGNFGAGGLDVSGGRVITDDDAWVGRSSAGGTVDVTGGGRWDVGGTLAVGGTSTSAGGPGVLRLNGETARITTNALTIWDDGVVNLINGELDVTGALTAHPGSRLHINGGTLHFDTVGSQLASGALAFTAGTAHVRRGIGLYPGAMLEALSSVPGTGTLDVDGMLEVSNGAGGQLTVSGRVESAAGLIRDKGQVMLGGANAQWTIAGRLTMEGPTGTHLLLARGAKLSNVEAVVAGPEEGESDPQFVATVELDGAGTLWHNTGSASFGWDEDDEDPENVGGRGTLTISEAAALRVDGVLRLGRDYQVTLDGGSITVGQTAIIRGTVLPSGAAANALHLAAGGLDVLDIIGGSVDLGAQGVVDATAGSAEIIVASPSPQDPASLRGTIHGNSATRVVLQGVGSSWTTAGPLVIGSAAAGPGHIGTLVLGPGTSVQVDGPVTLSDATRLTLGGGTLNATSFDALDHDFAGFGTINARFSTTGNLTASGALTLGDPNSFDGVRIGGNLSIGQDHKLTLNRKGFFNLGPLTNISGGTLIVRGGVALPTGHALVASGAIAGRIFAAGGSTIQAAGSLELGGALDFDGFFSDGVLDVGAHVVTLYDRDHAVLGSLTSIGVAGEANGTLRASRGILLEAGKTLAGRGRVETADGAFRNEGFVQGDDTGITFAHLVTGRGGFGGAITFEGPYQPGNSPARTEFDGGVTFTSTASLQIELGGTIPGAGHDQVAVAGVAALSGTLELELINGFTPAPGQRFDVLTAGSITGAFQSYVGLRLSDLPGGKLRFLDPRYSSTALALHYTEAFMGDANNDGLIDIADYFAVDRGRALRLTGWSNGDFDLSGGRPDAADYLLIDRAFLSPGQPLSTPTAGLVPEPALFTFAAGACAIMLRPRRQRAIGAWAARVQPMT